MNLTTALADGRALNGGQLTTWQAVSDFIFAGNATFTLRSLKTDVSHKGT